MRWSVLLLGTVGCGIFGGEDLDPEGPAWQIGAVGTPPVEAALVYEPRANLEVPDLAFDPMFDNRLWVMMRPVADVFNDDLLCEQSNSSGCDAMPSRNAIITNLGQDDERVRIIEDSNAWHFMRRTVAMAMGEGTGFWASCGDFWTGNTTDVPIQFIGPSLWSSSLQEHGVTPPGLNGSHYDMLHGTPWCTGIAWEVDNVYWNFNGELGALDRVNFNDDHGPGEADHSDGEYERYVEGELQREPAVPSHMEIEGDWLYVADTGNRRVVRLDITTGRSRDTIQTADPVPVEIMRNATLEEFVAPSAGLDMPSGLTVQDGILYVSDFEAATIVAFDTADGTELGRVDLSATADTVTGLEISPDDGMLYFTDMAGGAVYRLEQIIEE